MNTIGIDVSKDTFHAAFSDVRVEVFKNTEAGIKKFMEKLNDKDSTLVGCESTGVYHLLLCETLRKNDWSIKVVNPLITHRMIDSSLRHVKTDHHDALAIRRVLLGGAGHAYTDTPEILALKALVQEREALNRMRAETKQRIHAHKVRAKASGILFHDSFDGTVNVLTYEIKEIEKKLCEYAPLEQSLLRSIPGIGKVTAAALVAFVGDIHRFPNAEKLTAYIGLDSRVHESGTSIHGKGYMSKRGNKYLRYILFNAAFIARQKNPELKRYFQKKTSEGKHYFSALCAVERKLVHLIWAVWTRGTPFENR